MESSDVARKSSTSTAGIILTSSIGKKMVVAISGFLLLLFVCGHLAGNLQIFVGQDQINKYAQTLEDFEKILWLIRLILGVLAVLHIWLAVVLKLENWKARPDKYAYNSTVQATLASRTMIWSGLLVFSFVSYHLLHFTYTLMNPEWENLKDSLGRHDVYSMIILGFQNYIIAGFYILMMFFLAYHLSHGIKSMFQTLGFNSPKSETPLKWIARGIATILFLGYISIPIAIMAGIIKLPGGVAI